MHHRILSILAAFTALICLIFFAAAIGDLMKPEETETPFGVVVGLAIFFGGLSAGGGYFCVTQWKRAGSKGLERKERDILKMIAAKGGRITPEDIAMEQPMTVDQARQRLNSLCADGSGEVQVTSEGRMVYVFFGFLSEEERKTARSVLD